MGQTDAATDPVLPNCGSSPAVNPSNCSEDSVTVAAGDDGEDSPAILAVALRRTLDSSGTVVDGDCTAAAVSSAGARTIGPALAASDGGRGAASGEEADLAEAIDREDGVVGMRPVVARSSNYIGVTRHRWSGKFEAHLWDNTCHREGRKRKGRQVYLGSYDSEEKAARAHDIAALKYWGPGSSTKLNFPVSGYEKEIEEVKNMNQEECIASLRRKSSCFSRGASIYRGVTRRQKDGRWQARIGWVAGSKDIYLGTFKTQEEAAEAYDIAAIELRGANAVTNFEISNYYDIGLKRLEGPEGSPKQVESSCKVELS